LHAANLITGRPARFGGAACLDYSEYDSYSTSSRVATTTSSTTSSFLKFRFGMLGLARHAQVSAPAIQKYKSRDQSDWTVYHIVRSNLVSDSNTSTSTVVGAPNSDCQRC
jgi:hypothetical protein